ncbi:MAG: dihydroneopterin aldolase [Bacteroides sp.]|nr:dihydroneopterin aldolase [Bacteroides sp.]
MTNRDNAIMSITLDSLRFYARHGVGAQEREVGNDFEVSVSVDIPPVYSDRIEATVNYAEITESVRTEMEIPSALIEHVAVRIRNALMARFPLITGGRVTVCKLKPPIPGAELKSASVTLIW